MATPLTVVLILLLGHLGSSGVGLDLPVRNELDGCVYRLLHHFLSPGVKWPSFV